MKTQGQDSKSPDNQQNLNFGDTLGFEAKEGKLGAKYMSNLISRITEGDLERINYIHGPGTSYLISYPQGLTEPAYSEYVPVLKDEVDM